MSTFRGINFGTDFVASGGNKAIYGNLYQTEAVGRVGD